MSYRKDYQLSEEYLKILKEIQQQFFKNKSIEDLRALFLKMLKQGMHGICISPYEEGQQPGDVLSEVQVRRRMQIIQPYIQWIRSFSCTEGNEHVPRVAKQLGIKTMVGAWLGPEQDKNEAEIEALIELSNQGQVDIAAVGNEVLYREDLTKEQLLYWMREVRNRIPQEIPVGYVDAYYEFTQHPELVEQSDVILTNCYPFWEGCPIEYSLSHMQQMVNQVTHVAQGKPVIITETGWPSQGQSLKSSLPSEENALIYFIQSQLWAKQANVPMFYFSSFDESWKVGPEGDVGAHWGLWDKHEEIKYVANTVHSLQA